jgi:hypothetical protein
MAVEEYGTGISKRAVITSGVEMADEEVVFMERSETIPTQRSDSAVKSGANGPRSIEGTELIDELGPIPTFPPVALDPETGRMLPISDEEIAARREAVLRMLKVLHQITDESDTDENWRDVYQSIDAGRPHRPLFKGLY